MKTLYLIMDGRFMLTDGRPSSHHLGYERFGKPYLDGFDRLVVLARLANKEDPIGSPVEGPGVEVLPLPPVHGLKSLILSLPCLIKIFFNMPRDAAYLLWVPGIIPSLAWFVLCVRRIPYGVRVVADAADAFSRNAVKHPLRPFIRWVMVTLARLQCKKAKATSYVTRKMLQKNYLPNPEAPSFGCSDIILNDDAFVETPRTVSAFNQKQPVLINVGMMQKYMKGQDLLLEALVRIRAAGFDAKIWFVGDGDARQDFEKMAESLNISEHVRFCGRVAGGQAVRDLLDQADIFVLPSRQEGLPRAMIEAMARALPCVSSDVGGTNELIGPPFIVPADNVQALASSILHFLNNPDLMAEQSAINLQESRYYHIDNTTPVKLAFYKALQS